MLWVLSSSREICFYFAPCADLIQVLHSSFELFSQTHFQTIVDDELKLLALFHNLTVQLSTVICLEYLRAGQSTLLKKERRKKNIVRREKRKKKKKRKYSELQLIHCRIFNYVCYEARFWHWCFRVSLLASHYQISGKFISQKELSYHFIRFCSFNNLKSTVKM